MRATELLVNRLLTGDWRAPALAGALLALILLAYAIWRPKAQELDGPEPADNTARVG